MNNKPPTPEEFLSIRFLKDLTKDHIHESFRNELRWMKEYSDVILKLRDEDFKKVISKVNFLMNACLRLDNDQINQFICDWGKMENDSFGIDWKKIIEQK